MIKFLGLLSKKKKVKPATAASIYVALLERSLSKGVPNRCENIHNEKIAINFSKEELILAKIYVCN